MATPSIGSEGWTCAADLYEESDLADLVRSSVENTDLEKLVTLCSSLRQGVGCKVSDKFTSGTRNLVRLVQFDDGVKWAARIWMLRLGQETDEWTFASAEKVMESQLATYKYLKQHTTIPVPEVHGYNSRVNDELGPPYMLITYIHGTIADDMEGIDSGENEAGTRYVLKQLADMMVELASCKFDRIGSIFANEAGDFEIGPLIETDGGPYETAQEYYLAISDRRFHVYADRYFANNKDARRDPGFNLPFLFNNLMRIFTNSAEDKGPFGLTNMDFGPHNVLVDKELNIVGLIDCDGIVAAPIHVVAQVPIAGCLGVAIPGYKPTNPVRIKSQETHALWLNHFVPMVAAAEKKFGKETPIADAMISDAAKLVYGLNDYQGLRDWLNVTWVCGYWYLYYQRISGPSAGIEFTDADLQKEFGGEDQEEAEKADEEQEGEDKLKLGNEEGKGDDEVETKALVEGVEALKESCDDEGLEKGPENGGENKKDIKQRGPTATCRGTTDSGDEGNNKEELKDIKQKVMVEPNEKSWENPEELMAEIMEGLVIKLKKEIMDELGKEILEDLKKEVKEEAKRRIRLELKAELCGALEVEHSEDGLEDKGAEAVETHKVDPSTAKEALVREQKSSVKEMGHEMLSEEKTQANVAKVELAEGVRVRPEVDKERGNDDNDDDDGEEQCTGNAGSCSDDESVGRG